ncbi:MAG TPA: assimilatory sulfite reductase (NADPH) flavoprotein subunit [Steroidobacteraceae bacterium]|nr:assimilatory sulfite reductase (NADPH) flavoprotein subunit [Steroidobacteraceae bacterium]
MSANPLAGLPPLGTERLADLEALLAGLDPASLTWVSGFAAGLAAERARAPGARSLPFEAPLPAAAPSAKATVLYASQTGNGRRVAERLGRSLEAAGLAASVTSTADYPAKSLPQERLVFIVASTHGDGDPPDDARAFVDFLAARRAPRLEALAYAVLALGDSSYPKFCATGRLIDERLAELGARRIGVRVDADVDVEAKAGTWIEQSVAGARAELASAAPAGEPPRLAVVTPLRPVAPALASRDAPVEVELVGNQRITARNAERDVRHVTLALPERQFEYEPGDAIGVVLENPTASVDRLLELTRLDPSEPVTAGGATHTLREWLTGRREIARISRPLLERLATRSGSAELKAQLAPERSAELRGLIKTLQVADLLKRYPAGWEAAALVEALHPLAARLYSVASSRREAGDEAHLTVAVVDYRHEGERRVGPASWQLATTQPGTRLKAFVEPNPRFRVPGDGTRDLIMIGPGTGVAPFRGFLQQRIADGARGRHWLVFGGRHRERDFLYQLEWQEALKRRKLARLEVAFSRDQAHKVYVQDRLREHGRELYSWLEDGAHLYVCGDAERMAPDVHAALIDVVATHGKRSPEDATAYLGELAQAKRYARDVY